MDYCSACRRHLNGALVCPGCGAYAPDIAPPGTEGRRPFAVGDAGDAGGAAGGDGGSGASGRPDRADSTVPGPMGPAGATAPPRPRGAWDDVSRGTGSVLPQSWHEDRADDAHAPETGDVSDAPPAPRGRAARRRQRVRWRKSQRRAVVATAVALVGGGLTLASLDRHAPDRTRAAAAPDDRAMGAARAQVRDDDAGGAVAAVPAASVSAPARTLPRTQSPAAGTPASAAGPSAPGTPAARPTAARPDSAAEPRPVGSDAAGPGTATTVPMTGEAPRTTPADQPATATDPAPQAPASTQPAPDPAATSPSRPDRLCLLVVCLG
ncbi:hypothetical protein OHA09_17620 [Streptomyces longwoodensis]|uniref:SCO2400 family protein n=1 Tax=Streptomyces longwoodensis TaxID=68231 RepID=UPI002E803E6F|nr:hypothetical protein [Streptomyces longwoodensis]WUC58792.1 hypothetical protein OHA09_17620 [Streptomyces longwoodensis]